MLEMFWAMPGPVSAISTRRFCPHWEVWMRSLRVVP